jgi:hypothetical protein
VVRLVGAVRLEQTDEWTEGRRYIGLEILTKCDRTNSPAHNAGVKEVTAMATTA